ELGYFKTKYLYCEMMGRGSNLIFADENQKILSAFRQNDITTKFDRIIMSGMKYEPMPIVDKIDPIRCEKELFVEVFSSYPEETRTDQIFQKRFLGFGKLTAREIVYLASKNPETLVGDCDLEKLWEAFSKVVNIVKNNDFHPCLLYSSKSDFEKEESPMEFSFMPIQQYGEDAHIAECSLVSDAIEGYYLKRNFDERQRQHHNDISQILKNLKRRLEKKIAAQEVQFNEASDADEKKYLGDLLMQEIYRIKKGDESVRATDYSSDPVKTVPIELDPMLTPTQNVQKYYREYKKKKTALSMIQEQISIAKEELKYAESISICLENALTSSDLAQIRQELSHWNYGRRLISGLKKNQAKKEKPRPKETLSPNGFTIFVGMNNFQNDTISTSLSEKDDLWFHVKNYHGSHVLMRAENGKEFSNEDIEYAASLAAYYSEVKISNRVEVDFTNARYIKKPNGSKPGFITYKKHQTVVVSPKPMN
ncbi:MAG: NFACT family protein, partial [Clostridia bacterium]|nr:NFACT family protein [Clostridia bacterium]